MAFKKGKSGNPGGRPKALKKVEAAARKHTSLAITTLAEIAGNAAAAEAARVAACNALLDRAWGKAKQAVEHGGENGGPIKHQISVVFTDEAE